MLDTNRSDTNLAYAGARKHKRLAQPASLHPSQPHYLARACYAMPCTDIALATRCPRIPRQSGSVRVQSRDLRSLPLDSRVRSRGVVEPKSRANTRFPGTPCTAQASYWT
eukprot:3359620-Rhodomonas_salina.4